jgi:hypothetical protein
MLHTLTNVFSFMILNPWCTFFFFLFEFKVFVSSTPFDECFDITHGQVNNDMLNRAHYLMKLFSLRYSF